MGEEYKEKGHYWTEKAVALRSEIVQSNEQKELTEEDFNDLIVFWSR